MLIPKDAILMISGVSCVGKTTTAYEILKNYSDFRRVSEYDLIRTVVRTAYENFIENNSNNKNECDVLFASLIDNDFETTIAQSEQLIPYIKDIILRQQRRQIPTIIEGAGIVPFTYFPHNEPFDWLTNHVIFVNLYISSEGEHVRRRQSRSKERDYCEKIAKTKTIISKSRWEKNELLHIQSVKLNKFYKNVFSIDVSNYSPTEVANIVMKQVSNYFSGINR